jgi:hypothetical protein
VRVDFTFDAYRELLVAGEDAGYEFLTVREYLSRDSLPERFEVLRHDVDRDPERALALARVEADRDVASTYYFRTVPETFEPWLIREVEALGHKVGYHYEALDRANGNLELAHATFDAELSRLRNHCTVDTVCMHGNPLTMHDNRNLWTDGADPGDYDLLGEAYLSMDFEDVSYFSDTGRTWRDGGLKIKDHTVGGDGKTIQVSETPELVAVLRDREIDRLCLLAHPDRWARTVPQLVAAVVRDTTINVGKLVLGVVR